MNLIINHKSSYEEAWNSIIVHSIFEISKIDNKDNIICICNNRQQVAKMKKDNIYICKRLKTSCTNP